MLVIFLYLMVMMEGLAAAPDAEWTIRINIPACTLQLFRHGELWRKFPIAVGKKATPTPIGNFNIINVIQNPTWYPVGRPPVPPGIENPLGGYWLGLSIAGYGIHGNNKPSSIGLPESNGCIRMFNHDVEMLVRSVGVGTPVEIIYETVEVEQDYDKMWLTLYQDFYRQQPRLREKIIEKLDKDSLLYPVHWEALWSLIGEERPLLIEIPRKLPLVLDGEEYPVAGYLWGERVWLPTTLTGLWGETSQQPFIELVEFMRLYAGQVYGIFDQQAKTIKLHTLRIFCNGRLFPLRGWFQEEPYLPKELIPFLTKEVGPPVNSQLLTGEEIWVPLSVLTKHWPHLNLSWDDNSWVLTIDY